MFFLTYLRRELRRRMRQTVLIAVGLAVGVGLVITVTAASAGVTRAQATVLHSLYGIGTDITVTTTATPVEGASSGGAPKGQQPDSLLVGDRGLLDASSVTEISQLRDVAAAAGGLTMTELSMPSLGQDGKPDAGSLPIPITVNVDGVDVAKLGLGPFASAELGSGRFFAAADAGSNVAVVDWTYAAAHKLTVGSTITIAKTAFTVVGIVRQASGGGGADVYLPLGRAQALTSYRNMADLTGKVNVIYVAAASASAVPSVQAEISQLLPSATVTSSANLASQVSGSLTSVARLANDLGRWLAVAVLVAAFAVASLLTMAAVARRVREFGTLKALGWPSRRIIAQIMGESAITGVAGAALGVALGFGGAALIDTIAPTLSATIANNPGSEKTNTVAVHLAAAVTTNAITLAVLLAMAGALISGSFGAWRAARLRPADALAQVE